MRAIVNTSPGKLTLQGWPRPLPGPGQARIKTGACGICATDLLMVDGWPGCAPPPRTAFPSIPGHEWAGTVESVGPEVDPSLIGQRCVAENVVSDGGEIGFEHPGGYGQYLLTESRNLHLLPTSLPFHIATLIEPLAVAVRAVRRLAHVGHRETLILGDGPIGLLILMLLHRAGARDIVLVGGRTGRLGVAKGMGASQTLNYHALGADLGKAVHHACGRRFGHVIEASGADAAMRASLLLVAPEGRILVVGDYGNARADFEWNHLLHREISLIGSCASGGAWPESVRLASGNELPLGALVTHRIPVAQFEKGIDLARGHVEGVIKVVLEWEDELAGD